MMSIIDRPAPAPPAPSPRLGEELPVFCERCGYSLHGLPPVRCGHCDILQLQCPECGHHQPINTLRPAFQKLLGRFSAYLLAGAVIFKSLALLFCLVGWWAMGMELTLHYNPDYSSNRTVQYYPSGGGGYVPRTVRVSQQTEQYLPARLDYESLWTFGGFGVAFGFFARMQLLRWRRGYLVGAVLAALVVGAVIFGGWFTRWESSHDPANMPVLFNAALAVLLALGAAATVLGATIAFPLWSGLVHLFLPRHRARAVLDWQRGLSTPASALARS